MPGRGLPPSPNRRRTNADAYEGLQTSVPAAGTASAPPLPAAETYSDRTRVWYSTWCSSPQAQAFTVTDWQRLHMLAPLVEAYFAKPDKHLMSEIRLNESLLGATFADRLRNRLKLETGGEEKPPVVPDQVAEQRRKRILGAS